GAAPVVRKPARRTKWRSAFPCSAAQPHWRRVGHPRLPWSTRFRSLATPGVASAFYGINFFVDAAREKIDDLYAAAVTGFALRGGGQRLGRCPRCGAEPGGGTDRD